MNRREAIERAGLILGYAVSAPVLAAVMEGCKAAPELTYQPVFFTADQARIVSEVAEIMIPKTDTPGAKDVGVPGFIDKILRECYKKEDQDRFVAGLQSFDEEAKKAYGDPFNNLDPEQQQEHVKKIHDDAVSDVKAFESIKSKLTNQKYVDPFSQEIIKEYGTPETLPGTDNDKWMAFFPNGNFVMQTDKRTNNIVSVSRRSPFILTTKELTLVGFFTSEVGATQVLHYDPVPGAYKGCVPLAEVGKTWAT